MMIKARYLAPLIGLAAAAAIFTAPDALAADSASSCVNTGTATVCDGQLSSSPSAVNFGAQYPYSSGGYLHSGGHGGGGR